MDRRRSLLKIAALRSEREQQVGVNCTKGYLESTDAGLLFDGPRSMECFFNLRQSDGTQRPAQFSTSMLAIAVTPMDAIMFHCGNKSLQVSRATIGDDIHAVISYDGATAMCYINGIEVGAMQPTAYTPSALFRIGDPLHITKSPVHFCRHFNYALSAEEVAAHYNNGDPAGYVVPLADKYRWEASESNIRNIRFYPNNEGSGVTSYLEDNANGFTGRYAHIIWGSSGLLSVYSYQFMGHPVGCVVEAKFKYRSNAPVRVLADNSSLPINMEDAADATIVYRTTGTNISGFSVTVPNADANSWVEIQPVSLRTLGCIAEYLPQNLMIAQKRDFPQVVFPVAGYTPSSGVFNLNNLSATIKKNDQPQANGFSGAYTRFDAITSISLYCAYISDFIKKQAPLKITFEYRSNRILYSSNITASPAASDAVAIDVNEGDAKIASVSCGVGATAFVFRGVL